jgi:hypothetical protein
MSEIFGTEFSVQIAPIAYSLILKFLEADAVDADKLNRILFRHGLVPKWEKFERKYQVSGGVNVDDKERRKRLASLPFSEKLKILEKLRDRDRVIAAAGLRKPKGRPGPGDALDSF